MQGSPPISLPGVEWAQQDRTLISAVSTTCGFVEIAGFLATTRIGGQAYQLIALLAQEVEDGKQYLNKLGVPIQDVRRNNFGSLGIRAHPTLIFVDRKGLVGVILFGSVPPGGLASPQETKVLSRLE